MKKKFLTVLLCVSMALSLAACGGKEEPSNVKEEQEQEEKEEKEEKEERADVEEPEEEPIEKVEEQVELTADTIDKYFGFEYTATADDKMSGFEITVNQPYGTETVKTPIVPAVYSASGSPSTDDLAPKINEYWASDAVGDMSLYVGLNPFVGLYAKGVHYSWAQSENGNNKIVNTDGKAFNALFTGSDVATPEYNWAVDNNLPYISCVAIGETELAYPIMQPKSVMNILYERTGAAVLVMNPSDDYARIDDCQIVGFTANFASPDVAITVADTITADSTVADVVAKYAPSEGTMLDNGAIVLTWNTVSGATVEMTFDAYTYTVVSVKILTADMTPEILQGLHI